MRIRDKAFIGFVLFVLFLEPFVFLEGQQNPIQIDANGLTQTLTAGGLVVRGQIVKLNSAGQVVPVLTTDTSGAIGIAATSQTSAGYSVSVSLAGSPLTQIDGSGCAAGNIVSISTTTGGAGHCASSASGQQIGIASSISSPGSNFWIVQIAFGGGGGGASFIGKNGIDATNVKYGLLADTKWIPDATLTSGSNAISCPNNDCNFTAAADNGKICYGTNLTSDLSILLVVSVLPQGTLTVTGAQTATCSGGNWPTTTVTGAAVFVWGHDDTTALSSAWTDAVAGCLPLYLPSGSMIVQAAEFLTASTNDVCVLDRAAGYGGLGVFGTGLATTRILPSPNFDPTTCSSPLLACFFGSPAIQVMNLSIWGAGQSNLVAGFGGKTGAYMNGSGAVTSGSNSYWYNVGLLSWGALTANFTGFAVNNGSNMKIVGMTEDGFGFTGCNIVAPVGIQNTVELTSVICGVNAGPALQVNGNVSSVNGVYGWTQSNNANAILQGSGNFYSSGDLFYEHNLVALGSGVGAFAQNCASNCFAQFKGSHIVNASTTTGTLGINSFAHSFVTAEDTIISSSAVTGTVIGVCATCSFVSEGNNQITGGNASTSTIAITAGGKYVSQPNDTYTTMNTAAILPACTFTSGGGTGPSCTLQAGSLNERGTIIATTGTTPGSTGTITLTFAGPLTGGFSANPACTFTPNDSGTAWGNEAGVKNTTPGTASFVFSFFNNASGTLTALTASVPYRIDYICSAR